MGRMKNKFVVTTQPIKEDNNKDMSVVKKIKSNTKDNNEDNNHTKHSKNEIPNDLSENIINESINYNNKSVAKSFSVSPRKVTRNKFRDRCTAKRLEKGMIMLSPNIETKIYKLKKALRNKGMDGEEIKQIIRKRRREEENKYNRDMSKGCFKCRQMGHKLADCPLITNDCEEGVDICYRCGSSEHKLSDCTQKSDELPFAKCFLCSQTGHLTRTCRLNKRGIYPKGGSCKKCDSVNHLIKDCPLNQEQDNESDDMTLTTFNPSLSADAEMVDISSNSKKNSKETKVIKF